jgi:endonuclease YncB( thermonuclease family)
MWVVVLIASKSVLAVKFPANKRCMFVSVKPWLPCRGFFFATFSLVLLAFSVQAGVAAPSQPSRCADLSPEQRVRAEKVTIEKVIDGDTLHLRDGRKVRLLAINTPELHTRDGKSEPYALQATRAARKMLGDSGEALLLVGDGPQDHYGRTLAHVFNVRGESLSGYLLHMGMGWHLAVPPNLSFAECLAAIEHLAQEERRGVWQLPPILSRDISQGGYHRVSGRLISLAGKNKGKPWWLRFEGNLTAVIYPEYQDYFELKALRKLVGKEIEVGGWVYPDHRKSGAWRIKLTSHYDIEGRSQP